MRKLHRWISIIAAVFLLNQSITGMMLAWENTTDQFRNGAKKAERPTSFTDDEIQKWMQVAYQRARAVSPQAPIIGVLLMRSDGEALSPVFFGGQHGGAVAFLLEQHDRYVFGNAGPSTPGDVPIDYHSLLKRIHRGDFIGSFNGRYLTIAAGACLLFLLISGITMYIDMLSKHRRAGRGGLFWS